LFYEFFLRQSLGANILLAGYVAFVSLDFCHLDAQELVIVFKIWNPLDSCGLKQAYFNFS
jgi:hypothetical protein